MRARRTKVILSSWRQYHPALLIAVIGVPLLLAVALVVVSLGAPVVLTYPANSPPPNLEDLRAGRAVTLTVDATSQDQWRYISLADATVRAATGPLDWDLAVRRFNIIANGGTGFAGQGAIADLGEIDFDSASARPTTARWQTSRAKDSTNAAIAHWYNYGFTSHLLEPKPHVYLVRTAQGRLVRARILSYYCPGPTPGCVTLQYALLNGND
jgi:hypothetical protein